jgi:DmsE family decaheme c-type cytochrome
MWRPGRSLLRAGLLLTPVFLIVIGLGSCGRAARSDRAALIPTGPPEAYVGAELCKACHEPAFNRFSHTKMGRLFLHQPRNDQERMGCENCHGPGRAHVEAGGTQPMPVAFTKKGKETVEVRNAVCLQCHERLARLFWDGSPHESRDLTCTNCHQVMVNVSAKSQLAKETEIETCGQCHLEKRAAQMKSSHMPLWEGKMTCSSCHNPHGSVTPSLLKENSINDTCYACHAEKRGPFLWEHAPVVESCLNCHDPHGSNNDKMLKLSRPRLCQQCHIETRHPTRPYGTDSASLKFVLGRSCSNCHVNIHGSNHPSGFAFTR